MLLLFYPIDKITAAHEQIKLVQHMILSHIRPHLVCSHYLSGGFSNKGQQSNFVLWSY